MGRVCSNKNMNDMLFGGKEDVNVGIKTALNLSDKLDALFEFEPRRTSKAASWSISPPAP